MIVNSLIIRAVFDGEPGATQVENSTAKIQSYDIIISLVKVLKVVRFMPLVQQPPAKLTLANEQSEYTGV